MVRILLYIGWCFLDLKWTFYRALLPIYIKNDSGVFVPHLARATILTDSCQVFVLQLYLCNDSVLIILYYDHCPVAMYLICSHHFVVISTNEILDMQMYHRQLFWFETYFNCICYMLPSLYIVITALSQCTWNVPITLFLYQQMKYWIYRCLTDNCFGL